jgi:UDP-glucose 4-epimerase
MKKVCVIGGAGFLGSHVCDVLSDNGFKVRIFDTIKSPWVRSNQESIVGDVTDLESLGSAIEGCNFVFNFAAISDLNEAIHKPIETAEINIVGNIKALELSKRYKIEKFIYASSVYVNSRLGGFYRCSKHAAEQYVEEYQRSYGLNYTILRYGSLYGPRSDERNGLFRIVKNAMKNGYIHYDGSEDALREYIHVIDAANASVVAIGDQFNNQSVVLTGHEPMRVMDLLKMLAEILGIKDEIQFKPNPDNQHYVRTPYAYQPQPGKKYIPSLHVDLGQGLIELINNISQIGDND